MFCNKCGRQCADGEQYCPQCGNTLVQNAGSGTVAQAFVTAFNDPLFMVMCILATVSVLGSLYNVLFAIFMWLIFAKAKSNVCDTNSMRCVSGTVFALTVIFWVAVGLVALSGVLCLAAGDAIGEAFRYAAEIGADLDILEGIMGLTGSFVGAILCVVMLIYAGVFALINVFVLMPSHKLAKSMYQSAQNGVMMLERAKYTSIAMLVIGILNAVNTLFGIDSITSLIFGLCGAAVWIIAFVWIKKYFLNTTADGMDNYQV